MENIIEVENLTKKYKNFTALDRVYFSIRKGGIVGLLGPNGSGKSTAINCMLSLLSFQTGQIKLFGRNMTPDAYDIKQKIGVVFQDISVFSELTVYENIDYFCGLYISDKHKRKKCIEEVIDFTGLTEFKKYYPKKLSGGLLRRLNIACGIAHKPELIFLDEPTVAVDPQSRNNILEGIKNLQKRGATVIYTTHYLEEAELLCDSVIILDKGRVIANGSPDYLKENSGIKEKITIDLKEEDNSFIQQLGKKTKATDIKYTGNSATLTFSRTGDNLEKVINALKEKRIVYNRVYSERPTLNDVFLELTGKELRD